jgi:hypothetical protein
MRARPVALLLLLLLPPLTATADDEDRKADLAEGKRLLSEGDKLADKGQPTEALIRYKQAFEQILPGMRKLPFKREVQRDVTAREDLRAFLVKEIDEEMTPAEFRGQELGMKALGFIPRSMDYKEIMLRAYTEEIAAFYDPHTKKMHLIKEPEAKAKKEPSFFEKLLGKKAGFDKEEQKTVIAHELTHALADQNYDLDAMHKAAKGDDDRDLALSALIEGEATLTMMGAQMKDWSGQQIGKTPAADLDRVFTLMGPMLALGGGKALREAPPILVESMLFPYLRGLVFCAWLTNEGGWEALGAAYKSPPLSTEQVLHPDKYRKNPDAPMAVDLGKLDAGPGWKEVTRNCVGELQLSVLLRDQDGKAAAAGWDGDSFATFEGPDGLLALVWRSTWDTEADAREFARDYLRFQSRKLGRDVPSPDAYPDSLRRPHKGTIFAVERRGRDVAIVEGFPSPTTESLVEAAFAAKVTEKTHAPAKKPGSTGEPRADARAK